MDYPPEVIITESVETVLAQKKQKYADMLILYLLNRDRFYSIGAQNLYDAVYNMGKYAFGKKYSVVDVLTKKIDDNPDKLFKLLFLFWQINGDYERKLYGKVIRTIKENERIFNVSRYTIKRHEDKKKIDMLLQQIFYQFNKDASVMEFLLLVKQLDMVDSEYLDEIMGYEEVHSIEKIAGNAFYLWMCDDVCALCDRTVYYDLLAAGSAWRGDPVADFVRVLSVQRCQCVLSGTGGERHQNAASAYSALYYDEWDCAGVWLLV